MTEFPVKMNPRTETPKGLRLHIGLFGKRNAGKSSLMNALLSQDISIVSPVAGTTTGGKSGRVCAARTGCFH